MNAFNLATGETPAAPAPPETAPERRVRHRPEHIRVRVEKLLFPPPVSAGMNPLVLMSLAYMMRSSHRDPEPIEVYVASSKSGIYYIKDGRHRTVAAMMAGRPDVLAKIVEG